MNEKKFVYPIETEVCELNENNYLKPYAYQNLFAAVAEEHLNNINLNVDATMQYNLAWVLTSISFEIINPIKGCIKLFANTWYSQRRGPFFRRELVFKNSDGELMFHGSTFSVLLDLTTRNVFRKRQVPFFIDEPVEDFTIQASPSFKTDVEFKKLEDRKVYNSFIDCLSHVNNTRYGEFAYDALTDAEKNNLSSLKRMDIYFLSELRNHDTFSVFKAYDDNKIFIRGFNNMKQDTSFDVSFEF